MAYYNTSNSRLKRRDQLVEIIARQVYQEIYSEYDSPEVLEEGMKEAIAAGMIVLGSLFPGRAQAQYNPAYAKTDAQFIQRLEQAIEKAREKGKSEKDIYNLEAAAEAQYEKQKQQDKKMSGGGNEIPDYKLYQPTEVSFQVDTLITELGSDMELVDALGAVESTVTTYRISLNKKGDEYTASFTPIAEIFAQRLATIKSGPSYDKMLELAQNLPDLDNASLSMTSQTVDTPGRYTQTFKVKDGPFVGSKVELRFNLSSLMSTTPVPTGITITWTDQRGNEIFQTSKIYGAQATSNDPSSLRFRE